MSLDERFFMHHPTRDWSLDTTRMRLDADRIDKLPWVDVFAAMGALEEGAISNPDEERQVGHYWLRAPKNAPTIGQAQQIGETRNDVVEFVEDILQGKINTEDGTPFTDVIHIGIGGSALGPQFLIEALGGKGLRMHFVDNTCPDGVARTLLKVGDRLQNTLVTVVSKSGGTAETMNGMRLVKAAMTEQGYDWSARAVAVTGEGSKLDCLATEEGWLKRFPMWDWVGGRTSVCCAVGLLPAAFAGIDVAGLLRGAADMDEWTRIPAWHDNPAALLAASWHQTGNGEGQRAMVVLPYRDTLLLFSRYLQQLVMESLGKRLDRAGNVVHQGIAVYGNKGSTDQHAYVQQLRDGRNDFFGTFISVLDNGMGSDADMGDGHQAGDYLTGFLLGTRRALDEAERPSLTITLPTVDAYEVGGLLALFERAVGIYAELVDINAYHQPGVEAGKKAAASALTLKTSLLQAIASQPNTAGALAQTMGAPIVDVFELLRRLHATGRVLRTGHGLSAVYSVVGPAKA